MRFKDQYTNQGKKDLYRIGEDEKEYLFYKSKKNGLIIRDLTPKDKEAYYRTMIAPVRKFSSDEKKRFFKELDEVIGERDTYEDKEYTLLITSVSDKIYGSLDVFAKGADITVKIYLVRKLEDTDVGARVVETLKEMQHFFWWCDNLYISNSIGKKLVSAL